MDSGRLIILETGTRLIDIIESSKEDLLETGDLFNGGCTVIGNAYRWYDSRNSMSKVNKLFVYKVSKTLEKGNDIILIARSKDDIDKRLRVKAIVFGLPGKEED